MGVSKAANDERALQRGRPKAQAGDLTSDMEGDVERPVPECGGIA